MSTTTATPTSDKRTSGCRVELAAYATEEGHRRLLIGQRVHGIVRITDEPANGEGTRYLVEPMLESKAALDAIVDDYVAKALSIGYPPMHGWF